MGFIIVVVIILLFNFVGVDFLFSWFNKKK